MYRHLIFQLSDPRFTFKLADAALSALAEEGFAVQSAYYMPLASGPGCIVYILADVSAQSAMYTQEAGAAPKELPQPTVLRAADNGANGANDPDHAEASAG